MPAKLLVAFVITGVVLILQVRTAAITDFKARNMDILADALLLVVIVIGLMLNNPVTLPSTADGLNVSTCRGGAMHACAAVPKAGRCLFAGALTMFPCVGCLTRTTRIPTTLHATDIRPLPFTCCPT